MKSKNFAVTLISVFAVLLTGLLIVACSQITQEVPKSEKPAAEKVAVNADKNSAPETPREMIAGSKNIIEITSAGFSPAELKINTGDTVIFVNKDTAGHWPASAVHPTHGVYPEPGGCIGSKFDSCKSLAQGESWAFTFNQKGTWKYHDHVSPGSRGIIIVE